MLITTPLFMTNYTFTAFARNDQGTSTAMTGAISASLFNIVFDYIFMFPMKLGLAGAALATAISPAITMAICTTHYLGKKEPCRISLGTPLHPAPDFVLSAWNFSLCGRAFLSDHHHYL